MKNPYEAIGIIASVVILVTVLSVGMVNEYHGFPHGWKGVVDGGVHDMITGEVERDWSNYIPLLPKPHYNNYYNSCPDATSDPEGNMACIKRGEIQECKKTSKDYQEFFNCVHCPDPTKCDVKWDWVGGN